MTRLGWLAEMSDALVSVVFPSGCRICEGLLTSANRVPLCQECLSSFERVHSIIFKTCGRPLLGLAQGRGGFSERLAKMVNADGDRLSADVVVPVPLHHEREKERGYNQAALVSKAVAKRLRLPHRAVLLSAPARTRTSKC